MFLAINEIRHSKLRYALVTGVMFLIAYLVFLDGASLWSCPRKPNCCR